MPASLQRKKSLKNNGYQTKFTRHPVAAENEHNFMCLLPFVTRNDQIAETFLQLTTGMSMAIKYMYVMNECMHASIYPSIHLSIYRSTGLPIYRSICLFVCLSVSLCLSVCLSVCLSLSLYLSIHLSISLPLSLYLSIFQSIHLSI